MLFLVVALVPYLPILAPRLCWRLVQIHSFSLGIAVQQWIFGSVCELTSQEFPLTEQAASLACNISTRRCLALIAAQGSHFPTFLAY